MQCFSFWIAYILTRPLGASIGDYLSQSKGDGGFGIRNSYNKRNVSPYDLVTVIYLTATKKDAVARSEEALG